jgi:hypothetical protein
MKLKASLQKLRFSPLKHASIFDTTQQEVENAMKLWTSLLFLHGHIADASLATDLAGEEAPAGTGEAPRTRTPYRAAPRLHADRKHWKASAARLLRNLEYLGGRPMTAGHNDDIEEPFAQPVGTARTKRSARSEPCVTRHGAIAAVCGTVALSPFR